MSDAVSRGVPAQYLPENQDPEVAYTVDVLGVKHPLEGAAIEEPAEEKPEPRRKKTQRAATPEAGYPAKSEQESVDVPKGAGE